MSKNAHAPLELSGSEVYASTSDDDDEDFDRHPVSGSLVADSKSLSIHPSLLTEGHQDSGEATQTKRSKV